MTNRINACTKGFSDIMARFLLTLGVRTWQTVQNMQKSSLDDSKFSQLLVLLAAI
jgi:hypothetical protein